MSLNGEARVPDFDLHAGAGNGPHLILGGTGFVGRHLAVALARLGVRVILASKAPPSFEFPAPENSLITWVHCDVASADWDQMIDGVSIIHHCAWTTVPATANEDPKADISVNVISTVSLLESLRRASRPPRLVFASSGGTIYGRLKSIPAREDHPLQPISAYGVGKATVEFYLGYYRAMHGLDCRVVRLANPFGAGQHFGRGQGAVTIFLHLAEAGMPITIWGDGETVRDYIHIADASAGMVAVALGPKDDYGPWIFNIASGCGVSLNQIVSELERRFARRLDIRREPGRQFDVPISVLDVALAGEILGWRPRLSFSAGIGRTISDLERKASLSTMDLGRESFGAAPIGDRVPIRNRGFAGSS